MLIDDVGTEEGMPVASKVVVVQVLPIALRLTTSWLESSINTSIMLLGGYKPPNYRCRRGSAAFMVKWPSRL